MDSENKFWLCAWGIALSFLMVVVLCLTVQAWNKLDKWDKAVSNGADPMVTTCALYSDISTAICTILAQNRK
jgi:hypothetical protein